MKKNIFIFVSFLSLFLFAVSSCELNREDESLADIIDERALLKMVNDLRNEGCQCGDTYMEATDDLKWDDELERAAKAHSIDMNAQNYFSHTSLNGDSFADRINGTDYEGSPRGENIAAGYQNEEAVFNGWRNSPGHCRNMMNSGHTNIAVARSGSYWTMVFGGP